MKRLCVILLCCCAAFSMEAQMKSKKKKKVSLTTQIKKAKEEEKFLEKQWWLGIKGGVNLTKPVVTTAFSALSPTNYPLSSVNKEYESFKQLGSQVSMEATFYFRQLSLSIQPTYRHSQFAYYNHYEWTDIENTQQTLTLDYEQLQKTDHLVVPLVVKFDLTRTKLRPYIQAGGFIAFLVNAEKSVTISGVDNASGGSNEFEDDAIAVGAKDLFAPLYYGLMGGAGLNYHQGNVRLNLDISYQYGLTNAVDPNNRYSNDRLAGVGDVMDDFTLDNIVISLGCLFPLRFLGNNFKSLDKK